MPQQDNTQTYSINDFTPGIHRFQRVGPMNYAPFAPPGSASNCYRCWAKPEIGLLPFPTYSLVQAYTVTDPSNPICVSMGNMRELAARGGATADLVSAFLVQHGPGNSPTDFHVTRLPTGGSTTPTTLYSSSASTFPFNTTSWPTMDFAAFQDPTTHQWARCVVTTDPISTMTGTTGTMVIVRGWHTPTFVTAPEYETVTFPIVGGNTFPTYPRVFYHDFRVGVWQVQASGTATNGYVASDADIMQVSDQAAPTNIGDPSVFYPEMGTFLGAWGSWSTGEFIGIYAEGGAFALYGDLFAVPGGSYKFPGVMGTNGIIGPGALTPIGMVYCAGGEGVYVWNGDNTAQNISQQINIDFMVRYRQGTSPYGMFEFSPAFQAGHQPWGQWVMFPFNYVYDTATNSWWQSEDVNVQNFQLYCTARTGGLCSTGLPVYAAAGQPATVNTYIWSKSSSASSYFWHSNPIPVTQGQLVTLQKIEIVASNLTATNATVTIQPTSPQGNQLVNQTVNQIVFTIPANTTAYRLSHRAGYADYNIQLAVTAANTNTSNAAPTIHAINCDYTTTRPAGGP